MLLNKKKPDSSKNLSPCHSIAWNADKYRGKREWHVAQTCHSTCHFTYQQVQWHDLRNLSDQRSSGVTSTVTSTVTSWVTSWGWLRLLKRPVYRSFRGFLFVRVTSSSQTKQSEIERCAKGNEGFIHIVWSLQTNRMKASNDSLVFFQYTFVEISSPVLPLIYELLKKPWINIYIVITYLKNKEIVVSLCS